MKQTLRCLIACVATCTLSLQVHGWTLEVGQRIAPRPHVPRLDEVVAPNNVDLDVSRPSLLDLPAVEDWASKRGLKPFHVKKIYDALLRSGDPSAGAGRGRREPVTGPNGLVCAPLLTVEDLSAVEFPRKDAAALLNEFTPCASRIVDLQKSSSGGLKLVVELSSGRCVETVLIRHDTGPSTTATATPTAGSIPGETAETELHQQQSLSTGFRHTVCVSSQVGCAKACSFCATGTMGLHAQLSGAEILEQVFLAREALAFEQASSAAASSAAAAATAAAGAPGADASPVSASSLLRLAPEALSTSLRNVVFMGMGEPLDNYEAVHEALRGMTHQALFGLASHHVTVSTVGFSADKIRALADEAPQVHLALSLHGATQALRLKLMPAALSCPLHELEAALDYHATKTGRGAMLEYLLVAGENDDEAAADALIEFVERRATAFATVEADAATGTGSTTSQSVSRKAEAARKPFVNLIPYNPTSAGDKFGFATPSDASINAFHGRLVREGVRCLVRWSSAAGRDANGACGQLALAVNGQYPLKPRNRALPPKEPVS